MKYKILLLLIGLMFVVGCKPQIIEHNNTIYVDRMIEVEKNNTIIVNNTISEFDDGILLTTAYPWSFNKNNESEILSSFFITNYGDGIAENVSVKCYFYNSVNYTLRTIVKNIGNVENISFKYIPFSFKAPITKNDDTSIFSIYCITKSCNNCTILDERIPQTKKLIEVLEK